MTGRLNTARYEQTTILLNEGPVLIVGGHDSSGTLASAELYSPAAETFSYTTGSLNTAPGFHTATPGVVGYSIHRAATSGGPYAILNASIISATTYTDTEVQSGQAYYYVATSIASDGVA